MAAVGRAARAFGATGRKKSLHAPKGVVEGGQFIGRASLLHAVVRALTGARAGARPEANPPAPGSLTQDPRLGWRRPRLLEHARKRGVKLKRGAPERDIVAALRQRSVLDRNPAPRNADRAVPDSEILRSPKPATDASDAADFLQARLERLPHDRGRERRQLINAAPDAVLREFLSRKNIWPAEELQGLDRDVLARRAINVAGARPDVWPSVSASPAHGGRIDASGVSEALARWRAGSGSSDPFKPFATRAMRDLARKRGLPPNKHGRTAIGEALLRDETRKVRDRRDFLANATSRDFHLNFDDPDISTLRDADLSGVEKERALNGGMIGDTRLVTFKDGTRGVVKMSARDAWGHDAADQADAEQLASLLGRSFGAPVPAVFRRDSRTVVMGYVDGQEAMQVPGAMKRVRDSDGAHRLGLLDLLINQTDRHEMNWMVDSGGNPVGIDHGLTFTFLKNPGHPPDFHHEGFTRPFMGAGKWKDNDLTSDDIAYARERVQALAPDFEKLGRRDWHDFALARLDAIAPYAKGQFNRIAPGGPERPPAPPQRRDWAPAPVQIAIDLAAVPAGKRQAWLERQPIEVLRDLARGFGTADRRRRFSPATTGNIRTGGNVDRFRILGGQTGIEQMSREQLMAALRPIHAPGVAEVAQRAWRDIGARQWEWEIGRELKRHPVAVVRQIALLQPDAVLEKFGGRDAIAKMPKPNLIRLLEPAIAGRTIPAPRPVKIRDRRAARRAAAT